jgi:hypothetical protein
MFKIGNFCMARMGRVKNCHFQHGLIVCCSDQSVSAQLQCVVFQIDSFSMAGIKDKKKRPKKMTKKRTNSLKNELDLSNPHQKS